MAADLARRTSTPPQPFLKKRNMLTHGSLFSGIGGFDLAAAWCGWQNIFNCEINEFCRTVLKYHFPEATQIDNIINHDFSGYYGKIDIITGGFPCQPFSYAGARRGEGDERFLWPAMLRAINEISPRWIVAENVPGLLNIADGMVFQQVCADLENAGYEVQPVIIPACAVGAPHRRERLWIVAYSECGGRGAQRRDNKGQAADIPQERNETAINAAGFGGVGVAAHTNREPGERRVERRRLRRRLEPLGEKDWHDFPTAQPAICRGDDGLPAGLDGISFPKWRRETVKAYGNAIVPQVAYRIFKAIESTES